MRTIAKRSLIITVSGLLVFGLAACSPAGTPAESSATTAGTSAVVEEAPEDEAPVLTPAEEAFGVQAVKDATAASGQLFAASASVSYSDDALYGPENYAGLQSHMTPALFTELTTGLAATQAAVLAGETFVVTTDLAAALSIDYTQADYLWVARDFDAATGQPVTGTPDFVPSAGGVITTEVLGTPVASLDANGSLIVTAETLSTIPGTFTSSGAPGTGRFYRQTANTMELQADGTWLVADARTLLGASTADPDRTLDQLRATAEEFHEAEGL